MNILIIIIAEILLTGMWYGLWKMSVIIDVLRHRNRILEHQNKLMEQSNDIQQNVLRGKQINGGNR